MTTITVGTADLRAALTAVRAHASTDKEAYELHRLRLSAIGEHIVVCATDRFTVGLAIASVWEPVDEPCNLELLPSDIGQLLSIFKAGKESGDEPQYLLRLDIDESHVTATDCAGMFDGRALKVPRLPTGTALDAMAAMIAHQHHSAATRLDDITVGGECMSRFRVASIVYGQPLTVEAHRGGNALLVRCGESFLGMMMPRTLLEDDIIRHKEWAAAWERRLPGIVSAAVDEEGLFSAPAEVI